MRDSGLEQFFPVWEHELVDETLVNADPHTVFEAMKAVRSEEMGLGLWLARLRTLSAAPADPRPFQDEMVAMGWVPLLEQEDGCICAGLIGRFWRADLGIERVEDRDAFVAFDEPGRAKVLFAWLIEEVAGGTRLRAVTRVHTTDARAARRFRLYFRLIRPGAHWSVRSGLNAIRRRAEAAEAARRRPIEVGLRHPLRPLAEGAEGMALLGALVPSWPLTRRWLNDLGARPEEQERVWPGDELLERVDEAHTRAVDVEAPADQVWPWLMQLGLNRGGFHSYELIENLAGFGVKNVERIHPDMQQLEMDQEVVLAPGTPGVWVAKLSPFEHVCFRTWRDQDDVAARDLPMLGTWSFYLEPTSATRCRLLQRTCKQWLRPRALGARLLGELLEDPLDLVMETRLLRTVRRLAERGLA